MSWFFSMVTLKQSRTSTFSCKNYSFLLFSLHRSQYVETNRKDELLESETFSGKASKISSWVFYLYLLKRDVLPFKIQFVCFLTCTNILSDFPFNISFCYMIYNFVPQKHLPYQTAYKIISALLSWCSMKVNLKTHIEVFVKVCFVYL